MIIYQAIFPNNKMYIGCTINSLSNRVRCHKYKAKRGNNSLLSKAIRKYGFNNIIWNIIDNANSYNELKQKEQYYIKKFNTFGKNGYNLTLGGEGTLGSKHNIGKKRSREYIEKMKKTRTKKYGKKIVLIDCCLKQYYIYESIAEAARQHNINYTILKICRIKKSTYKNFKIFDFNSFNPNDKNLYHIKTAANSIEFKITNGQIIQEIKSINHLRKFLNISERQARNIYYKNYKYNNWRRLNESLYD